MLTLVAAVEVYDFAREIRDASSRSRYAMSETREEKDIVACWWFGFTVLWLSASVSLVKQGGGAISARNARDWCFEETAMQNQIGRTSTKGIEWYVLNTSIQDMESCASVAVL